MTKKKTTKVKCTPEQNHLNQFEARKVRLAEKEKNRTWDMSKGQFVYK